MTDSDIIRFSLMPKFSQQQTDYVLALEAMQSISESVEEINDGLQKIETLSHAYKTISKCGINKYVEEEFSDILSMYSINFQTQSVSACMEGLTSIIERVWVSIKNALVRLLEFLKTNPYFARWFNRCEFYRSRMADIISTSLKSYVKADPVAFNTITLSGWNYADFNKTMNYTAVLIQRLKNMGSFRIEDIVVDRMFYDIFNNLNAVYENDWVVVSNPAFIPSTAGDLGWKPFNVYQVSSTLYSRIAVNSMYLTRLQKDFERTLNVAIQECNEVLSGRIDGTTDEKIRTAKRRIRNIKNVQSLIQLAVSNTCLLCSQWCKLASSFDIGQRPYPA